MSAVNHSTCNVSTFYTTLLIEVPEEAVLTHLIANVSIPRGALSAHFASVSGVTLGVGGPVVVRPPPPDLLVPSPPALPPPPPSPPFDEPVLELEGLAEVYQTTVEVPSGVFFSHNDEAALRSSQHDRGTGYTIEIFLHDDAWVANLSSPVGDTSSPGYDLIMGVASAQSEARGWNRVVVPRLLETPDVLHRVSDTHLLAR